MSNLAGIKVTCSRWMLPGHAAWKRNGEVVWMGSLSQPCEDVEFDEITLHESDIGKISDRIAKGHLK